MGKGDKKSKKGKIASGSYGNKRKRSSNKRTVLASAPAVEIAAKEEVKKKAPARKKAE
jgi:30S ribosomal protein S31